MTGTWIYILICQTFSPDSPVIIPIYSPTNSVQAFWLLYFLTSILLFFNSFFILAILVGIYSVTLWI